MPTKKKSEIKIINSEEAQQIDPELEPAGFQRNEQLAERTDDLQQAAEEVTESREVHSFDPKKIDPIREIQALLDELHVDGELPDRRYFWCYEGQNSYFVRKALRLGWIVVGSDDTEAPSLKDARGYRKIGDTILMWTSVENHQKIQAMQEYRQLLHEEGVTSALRELGERYRDKGFIIHGDPASTTTGPKQNQNLLDTMKARASRQTAARGVDRMIREGTVPGMPVGGRGR